MEFSVSQIAEIIGGEVQGNGSLKIDKLGTIEEAVEGCISFLSNPKYQNFLYSTKASAVIVATDFKPKREIAAALIKVEDPYLAFTKLLDEYHRLVSFQKEGVEEPSYLSQTAVVGDQSYRGAFSYIGENVTVGNNVKIYPQAYLGDNVSVGDNTIIFSGVKIYPDSVIGSNCTIHAGAVIGSDGFGFAPQADGTYKAIPQLGNVILEDNVSIGANTVVDCATLNSTIIKKGAKLDNLIQIAHNVEVGQNTVMAAQVGVSGSSKIGENCNIGGQAGIAGHIAIGNNVSIGAQSGVPKSLEDGKTVLGTPSLEISDFRRSFVHFKKLPELEKRLKELEKKY